MPDIRLSRARLLDRNREREMLDRLVAETRAGHSRVLVLRGEAGIGKTALLGYLSGVAEGCRIARVAGIESEMELAFAACTRCAHRCLAVSGICPSRSATR